MPSQLSHGKFCEGAGAGGMDVEGLCPGCCAPETGGSETETGSSAGGSVADAEGERGGKGKKGKTVPGPGGCLDDILGFEIREVEKWGFSAWGLGRGVGMGVGEEGRRPRKLRKVRKVRSVKRGKVRMVLEEEGEEL